MKMFHIGQRFNSGRIDGTIVFLKTWHAGILAGCQLMHVMVNENPNDIWRIFKWSNGEMNRITRVALDRKYSRTHYDTMHSICGDPTTNSNGYPDVVFVTQVIPRS